MRLSSVTDITEVEVAILKYLHTCADKKSRCMWQELTHIKRDLQKQAFDMAPVPGAIFKLLREPECIKSQRREPTTTASAKVYRILREGRMVLLDVENGDLEPIKRRVDKSKYYKRKVKT